MSPGLIGFNLEGLLDVGATKPGIILFWNLEWCLGHSR
jgi:hypothetical protein